MNSNCAAKSITLIPVFIMILVAGVLGDKPVTNEQFVTNIIADRFGAYLDSIGVQSSKVLLKPASGLDLLARDGASIGFIDNNWIIADQDSGDESACFELEISFTAFEFSYMQGKSRGLFNKPYIRRNLAGQVLINFTDGENRGFGYIDFSNSDEVLPENKNYVASIRYKELAVRPKVGGFSRYLEPLAVTATVGGLIYLFFVNR